MAFVSYSNQLRDPRWQKKKAKILERDKYTCQNKRCQSTTKNLQVHHLEYIPGILAWEYPDDMLITLCEDCHDAENGRVTLEKHLATTLKMKGFLFSDLLAMASKIETDYIFTQSLLNVLRDLQNGK